MDDSAGCHIPSVYIGLYINVFNKFVIKKILQIKMPCKVNIYEPHDFLREIMWSTCRRNRVSEDPKR